MANVTCYKCRRRFDLDPVFVGAELRKLKIKNPRHYQAVCPACHATNKISVSEMQDELDAMPDDYWMERLDANQNFTRYLTRGVLRERPGYVVWGLNEVDLLVSRPFASEVFGLIRSWDARRRHDPAAPLARLTVAMACRRRADLFIRELDQSWFTVGETVEVASSGGDYVEEHFNREFDDTIREDRVRIAFLKECWKKFIEPSSSYVIGWSSEDNRVPSGYSQAASLGTLWIVEVTSGR